VVARIIDLVVHYFTAMCSGVLFGLLLLIAARANGQSAVPSVPKQTGLALFVFALLGSVAYETVCEAGHGSTLGKLVLGMSVVQEDSTPCRTGPALIRSLAYFIDGFFFGLVGYLAMNKTPQEQRHGDVWAHTIVSKRSNIPPQHLRGTGRFIVFLLFAIMADSAFLLTGLLIQRMI
jgi:uncharacterized RDD family membrane protein YckC